MIPQGLDGRQPYGRIPSMAPRVHFQQGCRMPRGCQKQKTKQAQNDMHSAAFPRSMSCCMLPYYRVQHCIGVRSPFPRPWHIPSAPSRNCEEPKSRFLKAVSLHWIDMSHDFRPLWIHGCKNAPTIWGPSCQTWDHIFRFRPHRTIPHTGWQIDVNDNDSDQTVQHNSTFS